MRTFHGLWAVAALLSCGPALAARTNDNPTDPQAGNQADARMDRFEKRLDEIERKHQADLKIRDDEIARLKALLDQRNAPL